jgi:hypothetical protein
MGGGVLKAAAGICEEVLQRLPTGNRDDGPGLSGLPVSVKSPSWAPGPGRTEKIDDFVGRRGIGLYQVPCTSQRIRPRS